MLKSYRELKVWQLSKSAAIDVYRVTKTFPKEEIYGLVSQLRRAATSVPSNIAEGHARAGTKEFKQFLSIAMGSVAEVETQLEISADLSYLKQEELNALNKNLMKSEKCYAVSINP